MIELKLTDREALALTYALILARRNNHHNWHNELNSIFNRLKD
jgi:hypothetical protein